MPQKDGLFTLNLGPRGRGAPDSVRDLLRDITSEAANYRITSQQLSDPEFITGLVDASAGVPGITTAFVERKYLRESAAMSANQIWKSGGKNEANRSALLALLRGGVQVYLDTESALQHANLVLTKPEQDRPPRLLLTSANLTKNSIDRHLNWSLLVEDASQSRGIEYLFDSFEDGGFADTDEVFDFDDGNAQLRMGSSGQVLNDIQALINEAEESASFAYFNITNGASLLPTFLSAAESGRTVHGVIDGDQGHQSWDPVGAMREAGINVLYYPGQMTGAPGRMHYKMLAIDGKTLHLGTANLSQAANRSLELGITIRNHPSLVSYVENEIDRLYARSRQWPLPIGM